MTKLYIMTILLLSVNITFAEQTQSATSDYKCIEINLFTADKQNPKTRALKRAAKISKLVLHNIRDVVLSEIDAKGLTAVKTDKCTDEASLQLNGVVIDYKEGNQMMRYMIGFGAGKQKIATNITVSDKATGEVLAEQKIVDRKIGGLIGGSDAKGKKDFAEKVNKFLRKALNKL